MNAPYHPHDHFVSLSRCEASLERAITRGVSVFGSLPKGRLVPIVIGLDVQQWPSHHDGLLLEFLRRVGQHESTHFVRFICHRDWVVRAGTAGRFYTDTTDLDTKADLVWTLSAIGTNQIGITVNVTSTVSRQEYLSSLSSELNTAKWCLNQSHDNLAYMMRYLPAGVPSLHYAQRYLSQFHLLMIPKRDGKSFVSVPLRTMTYRDGHHRLHNFKQLLRYQEHMHYELFTRDVSLSDHLLTVIDLIRDNDDYGKTDAAIKDIYGLAEFLFSTYMGEGEHFKSDHDLILFHVSDEANRQLKTYHLPIADMHKKSA